MAAAIKQTKLKINSQTAAFRKDLLRNKTFHEIRNIITVIT